MKNKIIKLIACVIVSCELTACKQSAIGNETYATFCEVPLTEVSPQGWLREVLVRQRDGLGIHRAVSGHPYNTGMWTTVIPKRKIPATPEWWAYEQTAYMLDGLYRCGLLLQDTALISLGKQNIQYVLDHPRLDGRLGPDCLGDNQWAFSIFARMLMTDYNETHNPHILEAFTNHFLALPDSLTNRQTCITESMCWTYQHTRDKRLLQKAEQIWKTYSIDEHPDNEAFRFKQMIAGDSICVHGVTAAEVGKQPASLYMSTGKKDYLDAAVGFFEGVIKYHDLVDGVPSSYEKLFGKAPEELHETCDISDFTWSYGNLLLATGEAIWADRIERAVLNAGMGAISKDFKAHQYFSAPNQLFATHQSSIAKYGEGGKARQAYRPGFDTECCSGNVHRIIPNYASRLWMKDNHNGIVAAMYAPSVLQTTVTSDRVAVKVEEKTNYPFAGKIVFYITPQVPVEFPFTLRIPQWAEGASIKVNNESFGQPVVGTFITINRRFEPGDSIELNLPMSIKSRQSGVNGISVNRGPLLFSLLIQEKVEVITDQMKSTPEFPAYDITPASPWNYALSEEQIDQAEVEEQITNHFPWDPEHSPVVLKLKANRVPQWRGAVTTPPIPLLREPLSTVSEEIRMIPEGATRIRLCVFPLNNP